MNSSGIKKELKILISAGETSSDTHAAELLQALRRLVPPDWTVDALGVGGPMMQAEGFRAVVDTRDLMSMGLTEVLIRLPKILSRLRKVEQAAAAERPDLALVMDYPDFHFRLARKLKRLGVPVVYYIPPKVWVWRRGRIKKMKALFQHVLCIFPFEEKMYREAGVPATYVGNPLVDELPMSLSREQAREMLELSESDCVLVLMPGSRPSEMRNHIEPMIEAAAIVAKALRGADRLIEGRLRVLMPLPATAPFDELKGKIESMLSLEERELLDLRLTQGDAHEALVAADAGIIKSGTSTLEAGLLGCPHVVVYQPGKLFTWVFKNIIRYRGPVGMVNLVHSAPDGKRVAPEILGEEVTPRKMAEETLSLLMDQERRGWVLDQLKQLRASVVSDAHGEGPSARAAAQVWDLLQAEGRKLPRVSSPAEGRERGGPLRALGNLFASLAWSSVNALVRLLSKAGLLVPTRLGTRVVSVGNIQAGGSGKTPLTAQIAREAQARGQSACILIRGYGGEWEREGGVIAPGGPSPETRLCGDEAALLHDLAPDAYIAVGADRVQAFVRACEMGRALFDLAILDDGFQNWKVHKDVELVALTSAIRTQKVFRDFGSQLRRASLWVWTKGERLARAPKTPGARVRYRYKGVSPSAEPLWLVTGVADAGPLLEDLRRMGFKIALHERLRDHAVYDREWARHWVRKARIAGARLAMTGKDWVKWRELGVIARDEVLVLEPALEFVEGRDKWERTLWGQ